MIEDHLRELEHGHLVQFWVELTDAKSVHDGFLKEVKLSLGVVFLDEVLQ